MDNPGSILYETRKKLNLSIDEVSEQTMIRRHVLEALERGEFAGLPKVYARSFLKTYLNFLGLSEEDIPEMMEQLAEPKGKNDVQQQQEPEKKEKISTKIDIDGLKKSTISRYAQANLINLLVYIAIILACGGLIYFVFFSDGESDQVLDPDEIAGKPDTAVIQEKKDKGLLSLFEQEPDSLTLRAAAQDSSWMRIDIDGKTSEQLLLGPGMEQTWNADKYFILTLGNAGAVEFFRNDEKLKPFGKKGTVVRNIKITEDKVVSSSEPWESSQRKKKKEKKKRPKPIEDFKIEQEKKSIRKPPPDVQ